MSEPVFIQVQRQFAAHIRKPHENPAPGNIEPRRLKIYQELFYNSMEDFIRKGFPVLYSLLERGRWHELVSDFFASHACQSPYFVEIPQEFVSYLLEEYQPVEQDPPFLVELAHYEWAELVLDVSTDEIPETGFHPQGDLLNGAPVLSPLVSILSYPYPVHHISRDFQPQEPLAQPVWLMVYRNHDDEVCFMEINVVTARLLQLLQENPMARGREVLEQITGELGQPDVNQIIQYGAEALEHLRDRGVVLGTRLEAVTD